MGCMGISDLAIIRCVFHINAAKKKIKIAIHHFDFAKKNIVAVASLNQPVLSFAQARLYSGLASASDLPTPLS
jgi:hypothetical protein